MPPTQPAPVSSTPSRQPTPASTSSSQPLSTHCHNSPSRCTHSLTRGDTGPDVTCLQQFLHGQGFTYVSATGLFDDATLRGVTQYQHDRSITGDPRGVFGPATRASSETAQRSTAQAGGFVEARS
ncbi:peptidoglycan-binding protein [Streptomyces olivochromogenes]|nr:peptidoglycan-binding protein [Streptomyces olivochromogenes]